MEPRLKAPIADVGAPVIALSFAGLAAVTATSAGLLPAGVPLALASSVRLVAGFIFTRSRAAAHVRVAAPLAALLLAVASSVVFRAPLPPLPALLPSLVVCGASWQAFRAVLPAPRARVSSHSAILAVSFLAAIVGAYYLRPRHVGPVSDASSTLTSPNLLRIGITAPRSHRNPTLFDLQFFVPFHVRLPAFVAGIALAYLTSSTPRWPRVYFAACVTSVAVSLTVFRHVPFLLDVALLPPTGLLLLAVSSLWRPPSMSAVGERARPPLLVLPFGNSPDSGVAGALNDRYNYVEIAAYALVAAYALQNPVWLLLSRGVCAPRANFCADPIVGWLGLSESAQAHPRPPFLLFVLALAAVALATAAFFMRPFVASLAAYHYVPRARRRPRNDSSLIQDRFKPQRPRIRQPERVLRVVLFLFFVMTFMVVVWELSWPVTTKLLSPGKPRSPPSSLCSVLRGLYPPCDTGERHRGALGAAGGRMRAHEILSFILDALRWTSVLCLPTLLFNLGTHLVLPYVVPRELPSVQQLRKVGCWRTSRGGSSVASSEPGLKTVGFVLGRDDESPTSNYAESSPDDQAVTVDGHRVRVDMDFILYVRIVTRGNNPDLVTKNARDSSRILLSSGMPPGTFVVEIVTDMTLGLDPELAAEFIYEIVVPSDYRPPSGALYKARALNYAISCSPARDHDWIVHLDEETRFDEDTVAAIMLHCGHETYESRVARRSQWPKIGQGPIMYGRAMMPSALETSFAPNFSSEEGSLSPASSSPSSPFDRAGQSTHAVSVNSGETQSFDCAVQGLGDEGSPVAGNWMMTLADSIRVSDDLGRYRLQYELGEAWFGMHGSFVVAANCVEKLVTFDHGLEGSIAEDAFFAMLARSNGVRFSWIDAFMYEQSPFRFADLMKQRARWLVGGVKVCTSGRIPVVVRSAMSALTFLWSMLPFSYLAVLLAVAFGSFGDDTPANAWYYHVLLPLMAAVSVWSYVYGFLVTFSVSDLGLLQFLSMLHMQVSFIPVFGVMEVSAVFYALQNYTALSQGFHVVQKQMSSEKVKRVPTPGAAATAEECTPLLSGGA